jgi:hypothetical protein
MQEYSGPLAREEALGLGIQAGAGSHAYKETCTDEILLETM